MFTARNTPCAQICSTLNLMSHTKFPHASQSASASSLVRWLQLRFQGSEMQSCRGSHHPCIFLVKAADQAPAHDPLKQVKKQKHRPGRSKRHYHFFKRTAQSATGTKAANLVDIVMSLSNVKEEIYAALDEWVAFEVEFPKIALGKALRRLKEQEQWQRIIQVSKWMLSKGQGQTVGTYGLMLKAYEMDSRLEDCQALWEKILLRYSKSMPKDMFVRMMHIYKRQQMPGKLVEVFEQMENLKVRPDKDTLEMVKVAYIQIGHPEMEQSLAAKYPPSWQYLKFKEKYVKMRAKQGTNGSAASLEADDDDFSCESQEEPANLSAEIL